jgi:hypothetical protein
VRRFAVENYAYSTGGVLVGRRALIRFTFT